MGQKTLNEAAIEHLLSSPERRYSMAAAVITGNVIAGVVIEQLRAHEGEQLEIAQISSECCISYYQCRKALDDLVEHGLLMRSTHASTGYKYNKQQRRPEHLPYTYTLTELGKRCTPRKQATAPTPPPSPQGTILMIDGLPSPHITTTATNVTAPPTKKKEKELSEFQKRLFGKA